MKNTNSSGASAPNWGGEPGRQTLVGNVIDKAVGQFSAGLPRYVALYWVRHVDVWPAAVREDALYRALQHMLRAALEVIPASGSMAIIAKDKIMHHPTRKVILLTVVVTAIGAEAILPAEEAADAVATARRFMAHFGKMIV